MKFEFAIAEKPDKTPELSLKTVYKLNADRTYDCKTGYVAPKNMIALRTLGGAGVLEFANGQIIEVCPNTLIFFRYNTIGRYYCKNEAWDFWWFEFEIQEYDKIKMMEITEIEPSEEETSLCEKCLHDLRDEKSFALASAAFSCLLSSLFYRLENGEAIKDFYKLQEIIRYLYDHIDQNVSVEEMAKMAGLSERRFRTVFFARTGKSPKAFLIDIKLKKAAELLKNTSLNIKQIALSLGYSEQLYFSRIFKKKTGVYPKQFRG